MAFTSRDAVIDSLTRQLAKKFDSVFPYNEFGSEYLQSIQKTIKQGMVVAGKGSDDDQVIYSNDTKASKYDISFIDSVFKFNDSDEYNSNFSISVRQPAGYNDDGEVITPVIDVNLFNSSGDGVGTFILPGNIVSTLAQMVMISERTSRIDPAKAKEILVDREIYELIPRMANRQDRINKFFQEYGALKGDLPEFDADGDGLIDEGWYGGTLAEDYSLGHDISAAQDDPDNPLTIDKTKAFITRLNEDINDDNTNKTLQWLRDDLNLYLKDIDLSLGEEAIDSRPEYENVSDGYLKIRGMNQSIIIRNLEGTDTGLVGEDINNPKWLDEGFTITMWVRFLDKTSGGTLFNLGNPTRSINPYGFKLETYVLNKDSQDDGLALFSDAKTGTSYDTWGKFTDEWDDINSNVTTGIMGEIPAGHPYAGSNEGTFAQEGFFSETDSERFIRLVVREMDNNVPPQPGPLRGSHIGYPWFDRHSNLPEFDKTDQAGDMTNNYSVSAGLLTNTRVPIDFDEWFFICATYNPVDISEEYTSGGPFHTSNTNIHSSVPSDENMNRFNPDYWRWNNLVNVGQGNNAYLTNTGLGARCKVEIISKSDLLRARGYKV